MNTLVDGGSRGGAKVALATLGCKVNQCDGAAMTELLADRGFTVVPFGEAADCYIVNTCTVTARTDYQSRQLVRRAWRANPRAPIVVTGCYAHRHPGEVAVLPGVAAVVGEGAKGHLPDLVCRLLEGQSGGEEAITVGTVGGDAGIFAPELRCFPGRTRAFLKIQDGCDAFCSYCAVPFARGRSRSLPMAEVLRRIANLGVQGYQEVVLTGIHLGGYGRDLHPTVTLTDLLRAVEAKRDIARVRLSSIDPTEITDDLMALLQRAQVICPHLHIPLQSGDDAVLTAMNRPYDGAYFRTLVENLVNLRPDMAIGVDVMAGFPGEDVRAFTNTCQLIAALPLAYLHVFPFSPRPGTPAAVMGGQVPEGEKRRRAQVLRIMGMEKRTTFGRRHLGQRLRVLLESKWDQNYVGYRGFTDNYIPVVVAGTANGAVNTLIHVRGQEWAGGVMIGKEVR
ncbi:MAG: tRNA (N(6)-L-threonylcarbamoyladenosine(37)-C(2))-methylthiotransferase MtaB [Syntrophales bacterium]|nr:tRNA (N(6)-L-threonylcarbamoyladenosine(37)-C(2))-methylthiotransferase MtaB [Syntrophales bacterium]